MRPCATASSGPAAAALGDVTLTAHKTGDGGWDFDMSTSVAIPVVPIADNYKSSAIGTDLCSVDLAARNQSRQQEGHREDRVRSEEQSGAPRQTTVPAGGGKSEFGIPTCGARCADVPYISARREMGQGRVPPAGKVFFGSGYEVKMDYTGAQDIPVAGKPVVTDHVNVSVKGPASDFSFEIFYARDAARTPLLIKIPVTVGTVSLELVR